MGRIRCRRIRRLFIVASGSAMLSVILMAWTMVSAAALPTMSATSVFQTFSDSNWRPIKGLTSSVLYDDPVESFPDAQDIAGTQTHYSAGFWYSDNNYVYFRERLMGPLPIPTDGAAKTGDVWQVLLDTNGDGIVDYSLQLDQATDNAVEIYGKGTTPANLGLTFRSQDQGSFANAFNTTLPVWSSSIFAGTTKTDTTIVSPYVRWNVAADSAFDGHAQTANLTGVPNSPNNDPYQDSYIDLAMPRYQLGSSLDNVRIALATSNDHNNINKDIPNVPFSIATNVTPEPSSAAILLTGVLMAGGGVWRARRKQPA